MKLQDLKKKLNEYPYVTDAVFYTQGAARKTIKNQLVEWCKKGHVIKLKKGIYTLNNEERKVGLSKKLIANVLYHPSYISLEYALEYYQMIPEAVFSVTSVTPKKTQKFSNPFGQFVYKNIKRNLLFGYISMKYEFNYDILIATPEKALLDFFYLKTPFTMEIEDSYFEESLRLQNIEQLDNTKMEIMAKKFNSVKINKILRAFLKWKKGLENA